MCRLIYTCVVHKPPKTGFLVSGPKWASTCFRYLPAQKAAVSVSLRAIPACKLKRVGVKKLVLASLDSCTSMLNTLHAGYFFMLLLSSADFFQNKLFQNILSGTLSECQIVWIQIRTDRMSVLIWVQTVCKGYQQTIEVAASKERVCICVKHQYHTGGPKCFTK